MTEIETKMCVLCFNSQWRSVVIGLTSCLLCLVAFLISGAYHESISLHLAAKLHQTTSSSCMLSSSASGSGSHSDMSLEENEEDECVFLALALLYPWPLWATLSFYIILNINLVLSAIYKWIPGVIFYLATDALFLGLMATALCMSFFPSGLTRIALLTALFPLLSLALCAWMTVFGFYLRLEDLAKRAEKRKMTKKAIIQEAEKQHNHTFINLAFAPEE